LSLMGLGAFLVFVYLSINQQGITMNAIPETSTESNSVMKYAIKLNPPDTAPKDGTIILALFKKPKNLVPAAWCLFQDNFGEHAYWMRACPSIDEDEPEFIYGFDSVKHYEHELRGWVPMPKLDGNLVLFKS